MLAINAKYAIYFVSIITVAVINCDENIRQLPHCKSSAEKNVAVLVGTLDGKLTALNANGSKLWHVDTGPGSLLVSNIHKLELTNNGQLVRIIPSLSGSLYKFDGKIMDTIPITSDDLLKSSFLYSDDLVIAGGREVRTYGVSFNSGKVMYECSLSGCQNKTEFDTEADDILVIERTTLTVRAHEPRSGTERWNFSVGTHNIKLAQISCINSDSNLDFDLTAIVPKGLLMASRDNNILWKHHFNSPIVTVWKWTGEQMIAINLFPPKPNSITADDVGLYVGMHNKQLYIHESEKLLSFLPIKNNSKAISKIPWKPVNAGNENAETGLSLLHSPEFANGNGFYLYVDSEEKWLCDNETNKKNIMGISYKNPFDVFTLWQLAIVLGITLALWKSIGRVQVIKIQPPDLSTSNTSHEREHSERSKTLSESSDLTTFNSRFSNDFETVRCLGKGGFGIVFEVRQNIDECSYAIKRITLPKDDSSKEKVMREVKILAKLDHHNIVRYYNSWVENPPSGWNKEHDEKFIEELSQATMNTTDASTSRHFIHRRNPSTVIDIDKDNFGDNILSGIDAEKVSIGTSDSESHGIYFENPSSCSENDKSTVESEVSSMISTLDKKTGEKEFSTPVFLYIQMQLCQKESLKDWLCDNTLRNYKFVLNIFSQILDAVEYIHNNGLIHRDLKPSNIFFSLEGNIKVGDFGLVTGMEDITENDKYFLNTSIYQSHTRGVGTQLYMSPEQRDGKKYNYKVDIWSLGIIFFELLVPFTTEMERTTTLSNLRSNLYPISFLEKYAVESDLLKGMLCQEPDKRPSTSYIKSRPILWENYK